MSGKVELVSFDSTVLRDNPLDDPTERRFPVYLPPGYNASSDRRYPVLYVLAGYAGTALGVENEAPWGETLSQRLDRLIHSGACEPVIVVSPDCFTRLGGSQYLNSSAVGRYDDYLTSEVVPFIDRSFRTRPVAASRGVFGKSSGGYGALVHLMKHPDVFSAAAAHAADMGFEYCYLPDFPKVISALATHGSPTAFVEAFLTKAKKPGKDFPVMNIICMAACYSPNERSPWGFDFPFHVDHGELDTDVWQKWLALDPIRMVTEEADALRRTRLLFFDCGSRDTFNLQLGARRLASRLRELEISHEFEEYPDDHFGLTYRYDVSIPKLVEALETDG